MKGRNRNSSDGGPGVPLWIVSFSDMVTLLLSFFVLLQALSRSRDPELFYVGQGSFLRAIHSFGLPGWLTGRRDDPVQQHVKVKHSTEPDPEPTPKNRTIDAEDEAIRLAFDRLRDTLDTRTSERRSSRPHVVAADILFGQGRTELGPDAETWLTRFAADLTESRAPETTRITVFGRGDGSGPGERSERDGPSTDASERSLDLAAARADAVADRLTKALTGGSDRWAVEAVGTPPDSMVWKDLGGPRRRSFILIVLEERQAEHG